MTDYEAQEITRLLVIAARAANKLDLNRHVYKYEYMKQISAEVVALEREREALSDLILRLTGEDWRGR